MDFSFSLLVKYVPALLYCYLVSLFRDVHYGKSVRPNSWLLFKSNFIANLQENNNKYHFLPRRVRTDIILTTDATRPAALPTFIANLQENNNKYHFTRRRVITDVILTAGCRLQSLNKHKSSKAAMFSDESTCCNAVVEQRNLISIGQGVSVWATRKSYVLL